MDINEFKNALKLGKVEFSYKKKDGIIRNAIGSLNEAFVPGPTVKFKCKNINWDTDGRGSCGLPNEMTIEFDEAWLDELCENCTTQEERDDLIEEELANELSDKSGFCVFNFEYERIEKRPHKKIADGMIVYYDIDKSGFRSFNESQLIDWRH